MGYIPIPMKDAFFASSDKWTCVCVCVFVCMCVCVYVCVCLPEPICNGHGPVIVVPRWRVPWQYEVAQGLRWAVQFGIQYGTNQDITSMIDKRQIDR